MSGPRLRAQAGQRRIVTMIDSHIPSDRRYLVATLDEDHVCFGTDYPLHEGTANAPLSLQ